jgi:hypothetical protein
MIDPATSWFEIVELPVLQCPDVSTAKDEKGRKGKKTPDKEPYFDKSSAMIANSWYMRPGFVDIHVVETSSTTMVVSLSFISKLISTVFCISDSLNYCIQY